jgi:hypothetical protein
MCCKSSSFMSEYSRWREWRSMAITAKPTAGHAKCRQPPTESSPPPRARLRLYARAHQVRRTRRAIHRLLAHVRQVLCPCRAEPPRPAARSEPPRLVSWWHARRLNARARQAAPCAAATPSQPSTPGRTTLACQPRITVRSRRAGFNGNISDTRNQALVAPPVPSRAAKTGGTPPTPRPPLVSLAKYGGQRNSQQARCNSPRRVSAHRSRKWSCESTGANLCFPLLRSSSTTRRTRTSTSARSPKPAFYHRSSTSHPTRPTVQIGAMCTHLCIFLCMRHGASNVCMSVRVMVCHCHAKPTP